MIVSIYVDNKEIKVDKTKNLIDELKRNDIDIPHFCYHNAMGVDGNCRMCLIEIKGAKRPQIACDTPIKEGMEIFTKSKSVERLRKSILELEFINHPLDCSVCDQVGECYLQEYYMKYDLESSRIDKCDKVTKNKHLNFGNGIIHDEERCVLCTRCVRFTRQISKTNELAVAGRGDESNIVVYPNKATQNRYAHNIIDVCPVGAMTSEDFRFRKRVYFLKSCESICNGCSKGCNIYIDHQKAKNNSYDEVYRYRPRYNEKINGHFMCDSGRYSYKYANEDRLPNSDSILNDIDDTKEILDKATFILSPNNTLEEMYIINQYAKENNIPISGYSDSYMSSDCDDFLIQKDKSANRKSLEILNIDTSKEYLQNNLKEYIILFNSDESLKDITTSQKIVNINSKLTLNYQIAHLNIPTRHYSQKSGIVINCDGAVQEYKSDIKTNLLSLLEILEILFDTKIDRKKTLSKIKEEYPYFKDIDFSNFAKSKREY
jgi:NADH-quinone oxidoreductase subunit G